MEFISLISIKKHYIYIFIPIIILAIVIWYLNNSMTTNINKILTHGKYKLSLEYPRDWEREINETKCHPNFCFVYLLENINSSQDNDPTIDVLHYRFADINQLKKKTRSITKQWIIETPESEQQKYSSELKSRLPKDTNVIVSRKTHRVLAYIKATQKLSNRNYEVFEHEQCFINNKVMKVLYINDKTNKSGWAFILYADQGSYRHHKEEIDFIFRKSIELNTI